MLLESVQQLKFYFLILIYSVLMTHVAGHVLTPETEFRRNVLIAFINIINRTSTHSLKLKYYIKGAGELAPPPPVCVSVCRQVSSRQVSSRQVSCRQVS